MEKSRSLKGKKVLAFLLTVTLLVQAGFAAFKYPGFLKGDKKIVGGESTATPRVTQAVENPGYAMPVKHEKNLTWEAQTTESAVFRADEGSVTVGGITISSDPVNLSGEEIVTVTDFGTQTDSGESIHRYDVSLGEHRQFEVPVAVTFPCTLEKDEDVAVLHYIEEENRWVSIAAEYNAEEHTVTAYCSSLSPLEVRQEKRMLHGDLFYIEYPKNSAGEYSTRQATVEVSSYYWSILKEQKPELYGNDALKFTADPALYSQDFENYKDSFLRDASTSFNEINAAYSSFASLFDLYREMNIMLSGQVKWSNLSEGLGTVSLIMIANQIFVDALNAGDIWNAIQDPTLLSNLFKNLFSNAGTIYSKATGYSSAAFSAGFIIVSMVGAILDEEIQYAKDTMYDRNAEIFYSYFQNIAPFNKTEWYETFKEAYYKTGNDPNKAMEIISEKIDRTVSAFWTDIYKEGNLDVLVAATEAETKDYFAQHNIYFYDVSEEQKAELNQQMKWEIWQQLKKEVMPMVNTFLMERMQDSVMVQLGKFNAPLNNYLYFEITEQVLDMNDAESVCQYPGCYLYFGKDGKPIANWDPIIAPEDGADGWSENYDCTIIGWHEAGYPDCLLIYASEDDMKHGNKPLRSVPVKINNTGDRVTRIDVTPTDENLLVWGLEKIVYCPSYSDDATYYKTNIIAGETYFGISHACEYGCDFTVTGMAPGKVIHAPNEFVLGLGIDGDLGVNCPFDSFYAIIGEDALTAASEETSFRNSAGKTSIVENDTLYGETAASRIECKDGNQLVLMINGGEINYFYRTMSEDEAIKLQVEIIETERPAHIPNPVVFPVMDLQMTERNGAQGEIFEGNYKAYKECGKTVSFKLGSNGDFVITFPELTASRKTQGVVTPEFKVTGNIFDSHPFQSGVGTSVTKVICSPKEIHYEKHLWSIFSDEDWEEVYKGTFTHTNPGFNAGMSPTELSLLDGVSNVWIELRKENTLQVRVRLYGAYGNTDYDISELEDHDLELDFSAKLSDEQAAEFTKAINDMKSRLK